MFHIDMTTNDKIILNLNALYNFTERVIVPPLILGTK